MFLMSVADCSTSILNSWCADVQKLESESLYPLELHTTSLPDLVYSLWEWWSGVRFLRRKQVRGEAFMPFPPCKTGLKAQAQVNSLSGGFWGLNEIMDDKAIFLTQKQHTKIRWWPLWSYSRVWYFITTLGLILPLL